MQNPQLARWQRFRNSRNTALASEHGWLTLTSFQWLEGEPAAVELAPGLWSTDGTAAFLTAAASDGLTLVETGEPVDGTISAVLADEESLMWVQYGGDDGRQVVVELAMRADKYAIRTRDSQSPAFTEFDGVPTFDFRPDLVIEARFSALSRARGCPDRHGQPARGRGPPLGRRAGLPAARHGPRVPPAGRGGEARRPDGDVPRRDQRGKYGRVAEGVHGKARGQTVP